MQPSPSQPLNQFPQTPTPTPENPFASAQVQAGLKVQYLKQAYNAAGSNFYTIAIFSLVNSVINYFQISVYFPVGLGITQIIDVFTYTLMQENSKAGTVFFGIGVVLNLIILGVVAMFGFMVKKQISWAILLGAVLYLLDGILLLLFQDWIAPVFMPIFFTGYG